MNSIVGRFHVEAVDEKQYLVYHLDKNYLSVPTLFLCPLARLKSLGKRYANLSEEEWDAIKMVDIDSSPYFNNVIQQNECLDDYKEKKRLDFDNHHSVLPLFWCKNKYDGYDKDDGYYGDDDDDDDDGYGDCKMCYVNLKTGTDYYFCVKCDDIYHKECVESPPEIKHPYHPDHPLSLSLSREGVYFGHSRKNKGSRIVYRCTLCNVSKDNISALKSTPFVMEKTKRHDHPVTFFTRKDHLRCNVCSLINNTQPTFVCLECDFVVHQDCADFPSVIRISRHHHRISFTSSLPLAKWSCGVCRKNVDGDYGAYTCKKCDGYVVHSRCALRRDIWDGEELEGIREEDDIEEVLDPFERISDGMILHFLHKHALRLETSGDIYDESKICYACVLSIYEGKFYSCMECDFILHDSCANAPCRKHHPLHPHSLTLKITSEYDEERYFKCDACFRHCSGFVYECNTKKYCFRLDVRCGSISEPFIFQGHEDPLFLALDPREKHSCKVCQADDKALLNCIECDFIICLKCVNLPYMAKYKHDKHFLTLIHGKETNEPDWCEVCERLLISSEEETRVKQKDGEDKKDKRFYECKQCCTTLHINCLLGKNPYMKPGYILKGMVQIIANNSLSRPSCNYCGDRCADQIVFSRNNRAACCLIHIIMLGS